MESVVEKTDRDQQIGSCCSAGSLIEPGVGLDDEKISGVAWRLGIAVVLAGQTMMLGLGINMTPPEFGGSTYWVLHFLLLGCVLIVCSLLGGPLAREMWLSVKERRVSVEGLFVLSIVGALVGSLVCTLTGIGSVYYEVVAIVLVIYTVGKTLGARSREKAISESNKVKEEFDYAYVLDECGSRVKKPLSDVGCCCQVVVSSGEAITVDGVILSGEGFIKETVMSGELGPVARGVGDFVLAGSYSVDGVFTIRPTAVKGSRKLDALIETVEGARLAPSALQEQADQLMKRFLPLVVSICLGTFIFWVMRGSWQGALFNSMAVLLVACPCALGLATPLAVWRGLWKLSTMGLVSRSGEFLDVLARADRVVFDKTGTLSGEELRVVGCATIDDGSEEELRELVGVIESRVGHPVARALSQMGFSRGGYEVKRVKEIQGKGVDALVYNKGKACEERVKIGELSLMNEIAVGAWGPLLAKKGEAKKLVYVSVNGEVFGVVFLDEKLREGTAAIFNKLKELGLKGVVLTGDTSGRWSEIEGLKVESGLSPSEKEAKVKGYEEHGEWVLYVGDGMNDAGAMAISRASIAMGGGAALTQSTASAILMGETLESLPEAITLCRLIRKNVKGNMIFAAVYNCAGMSLAAAGMLHPVLAAVLMLISSLCVSVRVVKDL